jgi:signal transduction histidine kinase
MLAFADILGRNAPENLQKQQMEYVDAIRRSGHRLQSLINDLLDVSRIDSGRFTLQETEFDAGQLLEEVVRSFGPILEARAQRLVTSVPDQTLALHADRDRLSQVVANVLSNASKYSPDGASIWLDVRAKGDTLFVQVRDQGIGISEEDRAHLFTPFFRASNEETRSVPGTGLGLVIAKSIVEMHGGDVALDSAWGAGTTFRFHIPRLLPNRLPPQWPKED